MTRNTKQISYPKLVAVIQLICISLLVLLHIGQVYFYIFQGVHYTQLDLNKEENLPTVYASVIILLCAVCLLFIGFKKFKDGDNYKYAWLVLGIIFIFLSCDEYFSIHDPLSEQIRQQVEVSESLYFAWVIPYSILTLIFVLSYLKFWINLPKPYRTLFFISGFIFVTGAIGYEIVGAPYTVQWGRGNTFYLYFTTVEETFEMVGIALFFYALVRYITEFYGKERTN